MIPKLKSNRAAGDDHMGYGRTAPGMDDRCRCTTLQKRGQVGLRELPWHYHTLLYNNTESAWIRVNTPTHSLVFGGVYFPPDLSNDTNTVKNLCSTLRCVREKYADESLILMGDFNQSQLALRLSQDGVVILDSSVSRLSKSCSALLDEFKFAGWYQVLLATYIRQFVV